MWFSRTSLSHLHGGEENLSEGFLKTASSLHVNKRLKTVVIESGRSWEPGNLVATKENLVWSCVVRS